jgi:hypothetical protein
MTAGFLLLTFIITMIHLQRHQQPGLLPNHNLWALVKAAINMTIVFFSPRFL